MNPIKIIKKYYRKQKQIENILLLHGTLVATKALEIAKIHPELDINLSFVFESALLHDIGVYLCYAPNINCFGSLPYICHGYVGANILRKEHLPMHALVCERHIGSGLTKEYILRCKLPIPSKNFLPKTIEEKLVCFADKFYSKSNANNIKSISNIKQSLLRYGDKKSVLRFENMLNLFLK